MAKARTLAGRAASPRIFGCGRWRRPKGSSATSLSRATSWSIRVAAGSRPPSPVATSAYGFVGCHIDKGCVLQGQARLEQLAAQAINDKPAAQSGDLTPRRFVQLNGHEILADCTLEDDRPTPQLPAEDRAANNSWHAADVLSFFSGAMGLDLGLENAGFSVRLMSEIDKDAVETIKANRPDIPVIGNIHGYTAAQTGRQQAPGTRKSPWSSAGRRARRSAAPASGRVSTTFAGSPC